ncbi:MAG: HEPN domain-containing protein [Rhodothermaceae bacterium]|nr:HEPN domain-containing protein [Rhodothermaceae bacterium]
MLIERSLKLIKTHSISELNNILYQDGLEVGLVDEDCDFLDSIYIPSKYPLGNALPHFVPNEEICEKGLRIAERIYFSVVQILSKL